MTKSRRSWTGSSVRAGDLAPAGASTPPEPPGLIAQPYVSRRMWRSWIPSECRCPSTVSMKRGVGEVPASRAARRSQGRMAGPQRVDQARLALGLGDRFLEQRLVDPTVAVGVAGLGFAGEGVQDRQAIRVRGGERVQLPGEEDVLTGLVGADVDVAHCQPTVERVLEDAEVRHRATSRDHVHHEARALVDVVREDVGTGVARGGEALSRRESADQEIGEQGRVLHLAGDVRLLLHRDGNLRLVRRAGEGVLADGLAAALLRLEPRDPRLELLELMRIDGEVLSGPVVRLPVRDRGTASRCRATRSGPPGRSARTAPASSWG